MHFFTARRWAWREMWRLIVNDFKGFLIAMGLAALAITVPLFITTLGLQLSEPLGQLSTNAEITVFAKSKTAIDPLVKSLRQVDAVIGTQIVNRDEAFKSLNARLGLKSTKNNPLPDIVIVTLKDNLTKEAIQQSADAIEKVKGVDMIAYDTSWPTRLAALKSFTLITLGAFAFVVIGLILLALIVANQLNSAQLLPALRTYYLFGASPSFATRPFSWRGFVQMSCAMLLAWALCAGLLGVLHPYLNTLAATYEIVIPSQPLRWQWLLGLTLASGLLGWGVSGLFARNSWRKVMNA